jgi:hypothetical protein
MQTTTQEYNPDLQDSLEINHFLYQRKRSLSASSEGMANSVISLTTQGNSSSRANNSTALFVNCTSTLSQDSDFTHLEELNILDGETYIGTGLTESILISSPCIPKSGPTSLSNLKQGEAEAVPQSISEDDEVTYEISENQSEELFETEYPQMPTFEQHREEIPPSLSMIQTTTNTLSDISGFESLKLSLAQNRLQTNDFERSLCVMETGEYERDLDDNLEGLRGEDNSMDQLIKILNQIPARYEEPRLEPKLKKNSLGKIFPESLNEEKSTFCTSEGSPKTDGNIPEHSLGTSSQVFCQ